MASSIARVLSSLLDGPGCYAMSGHRHVVPASPYRVTAMLYRRRHVVWFAQSSVSHPRGDQCIRDLISLFIALIVTIQFVAVPSYLSNRKVLGYHGSHARDTRGLWYTRASSIDMWAGPWRYLESPACNCIMVILCSSALDIPPTKASLFMVLALYCNLCTH